MKEQDLKLFAKEYNKNVNKIKDTYSEISKLRIEIANDSRLSEIRELEEELKKDPRYKRLEELKAEVFNDPRKDKISVLKDQLYFYESERKINPDLTPEEYAFYKTYPRIVDKNDSYGILVRFGPYIQNDEYLPFEDIPDNDPNNKIVYFYADIENFLTEDIVKVEDASTFEINKKVIHYDDDICHYALQQEFYTLLLESMDPDVAFNTMAEKYNNNLKQENNKSLKRI